MSGAAILRAPGRAAAPVVASRRLRMAPSALLLVLLCALQLACLLRAPAAWLPATVAVALAPGTERLVDGAALGLPPAANAALRLRRDASGAWWGAAAGRAPLRVQHGAALVHSASVVLAPGLRFRLGTARFVTQAAGAGGLELAQAATRWSYDGATLLRDGIRQPDCADTGMGARAALAWNRWLPAMLRMRRALLIGGNLDCGNRIAIRGVPPQAATIRQTAEGMLLAAAGAASPAPLLLETGAGHQDALFLAQREARLDDAHALQLGRTRLSLQLSGGELLLQPVAHAALYREPRRRLPDGVRWSWVKRNHWELPRSALAPMALTLGLAAAAGTAMLVTGVARRLGRRRCIGAQLALLLLGAGATLLFLQRSNVAVGVGLALLAGWGALWSLWAARGRSPAIAAAVPLLAIGLLAQLELGLGAHESSWLRYAGKTAALLALAAGAIGLLRALWPMHAGHAPNQARAELALLAMACAALLGLLLQVAFGDETGVFDLQPVEFAKLALAALGAHCLALACGAQTAPGGILLRLLRPAAPALLFLLLLAVALVQVDDYSPLLLLAVWAGAMILAFALARRRRLLAGAVLLTVLAAIAGVVVLRAAGPGAFAHWNFYAERFAVWLDPAAHPHTGAQALRAAQAIADGGWFGADRAFGLRTLGLDSGAALRIPAVQDDFAPAFFLYRHGLLAALLLWLLQALFVTGLLQSALRCWLGAGAARDFRVAWAMRLRCFLLGGGAAFVAGHLLLAWGTNLAIFPVMGQPMSFLSAGGSHLLFFLCPLLAAGIDSETEFR